MPPPRPGRPRTGCVPNAVTAPCVRGAGTPGHHCTRARRSVPRGRAGRTRCARAGTTTAGHGSCGRAGPGTRRCAWRDRPGVPRRRRTRPGPAMPRTPGFPLVGHAHRPRLLRAGGRIRERAVIRQPLVGAGERQLVLRLPGAGWGAPGSRSGSALVKLTARLSASLLATLAPVVRRPVRRHAGVGVGGVMWSHGAPSRRCRFGRGDVEVRGHLGRARVTPYG